MSFEDEIEIPIKCPNCRVETKQLFTRLKLNDRVVCVCGATIDVDTSDAARTVEQIKRSLADLTNKFR